MIAAAPPPADDAPSAAEGPWRTFERLQSLTVERFPDPERAQTLVLFLDRVRAALDLRASQPPPTPGAPPQADGPEALLTHLEEFLEALLAQDNPRGGP